MIANDDNDDRDILKGSFKPERKKSGRRNLTSALPQKVPLTSSLIAILDNLLVIILYFTRLHEVSNLYTAPVVSVRHTSPDIALL